MLLKKAFSLIELVVVIAIIGILVGIFTPTFSGYQKQKRIEFSADLLQTHLQGAFSQSRSLPQISGVRGSAGSSTYMVFSCGYGENIKCEQGQAGYENTVYELERGISFVNKFFIQFLPPHGDIDDHSDRITLDDKSQIVLQTSDEKIQKKLQIHKKSGLIEKITE